MNTIESQAGAALQQRADLDRAGQAARSPSRILMPLVAIVFTAFLVVGAAIPVLPLYVTGKLGMSAFVVGIVSGAQFAASLVSRIWSGRFADKRGGKLAVLVGLVVSAVAGVIYLASMVVLSNQAASVTVLILGRAMLGAGESFIITGALSWGLAAVGPGHTGRVMSWVGMAMYVGFAAGGPLGSALYALNGFWAIAVATAVIPMLALAAVLRMNAPRKPQEHASNAPTQRVLSAVWIPGVALALSSVGFGTLTTFAPLLLAHTNWGPNWTAFSAFSVAFVLARFFLGHVPDRFSGAKVAVICVLVEGAGQWLVWQATGLPSMLIGSALTGLGYALVYPALGVEAVRRVPARSRALAMGSYTAFLDLMLGLGSPVLGWIAGSSGIQAVFAVGAITAVCSAVVAAVLTLSNKRIETRSAAL